MATQHVVRRHLEEAENAADGTPPAASAPALKSKIPFFKPRSPAERAAKQQGLIKKLRQRDTEDSGGSSNEFGDSEL